MPLANVNGIRLFYGLSGTGDVPLVLVHGSWVSHHDWDRLISRGSGSFRVLTYDRRGHSDSQRPSRQGSVREDVDDLAALIEYLDLAPAWVVGNSFGGSITLRLAGERPELLRGIIVHEPPLFGLLKGDSVTAPLLEEVGKRIATIVEQIATGDHAGAAEQFVEKVALGPGSWARLGPDARKTIKTNALTFLDEARDPESLEFDPAWITAFSGQALLTSGGQSPPTSARIVEKLTAALPDLECIQLSGAGHIPHVAHPDVYAETIKGFISRTSA